MEPGYALPEPGTRLGAPGTVDRPPAPTVDPLVTFHYTPSVKAIVYSRSAQKTLARMPRNWAILIRDKIAAYAEDPAAHANNVKKLKGQDNLMRLRVGDWRVIMRDSAVLLILKVSSRGSAY